MVRLPEQGVVSTNRVGAGGQVGDQRVAESQHAQWCPVDRNEDFAKADVGSGLARDGQPAVSRVTPASTSGPSRPDLTAFRVVITQQQGRRSGQQRAMLERTARRESSAACTGLTARRGPVWRASGHHQLGVVRRSLSVYRSGLHARGPSPSGDAGGTGVLPPGRRRSRAASCCGRAEIDPDDRAIIARVMDPVRGPEVLIREWLMPHLGQTYAELERGAQRGPAGLAPSDLCRASGRSLSVCAGYQRCWRRCRSSRFTIRRCWRRHHTWRAAALRRVLRPARSMGGESIDAALGRGRVSPPPARWAWRRSNPLIDGQFSPHLNLAMFSSVLASPQADWPTPSDAPGLCSTTVPTSCRRSSTLSSTAAPHP